MAKPMKDREAAKILTRAGWRYAGTNSHAKFFCPCTRHTFALAIGHGNVSAGVIRKMHAAINSCN